MAGMGLVAFSTARLGLSTPGPPTEKAGGAVHRVSGLFSFRYSRSKKAICAEYSFAAFEAGALTVRFGLNDRIARLLDAVDCLTRIIVAGFALLGLSGPPRVELGTLPMRLGLWDRMSSFAIGVRLCVACVVVPE